MTNREVVCILDFKVQTLWLCRKFLTSAAILSCTLSYLTIAKKLSSRFAQSEQQLGDTGDAWLLPTVLQC